MSEVPYLRNRLGDLLRQRLENGKATRNQLAKDIDIQPARLKAILNDDWRHITRDALERTAEFLKVTTPDQMFELLPNRFGGPLQAGTCWILCRRPPGRRDTHVTDDIQSFLAEDFGVEKVDFADSADQAEAEQAFRAHAHENCIVIGSPRANPATQVFLSRLVGSAKEVPFGFCWPKDGEQPAPGPLTWQGCASPGIAFKNGHVPADYLPKQEFLKLSTTKGRDCGVVVVANNPFGAAEEKKLVILAGFSGIGTIAAAKALVRDFRDLEPVEGETLVWGLVAARYSKVPHPTDGRDYKEYTWKYRQGGREPIAFKK